MNNTITKFDLSQQLFFFFAIYDDDEGVLWSFLGDDVFEPEPDGDEDIVIVNSISFGVILFDNKYRDKVVTFKFTWSK